MFHDPLSDQIRAGCYYVTHHMDDLVDMARRLNMNHKIAPVRKSKTDITSA